MTVRAVATSALLAGTLFGCGSGGQGANATPPDVPFTVIAPEDARIVVAAHAVSTRVGHAVNYDIDAALLKEYAPRLSEMVPEMLETVARGVDRARATDFAASSRACLAVGTVKIQLDERARESSAYLDTRTGILLLRVPTSATAFANEERIAAALIEADAPVAGAGDTPRSGTE